jgi:hypothetical protein
MHGWVSLIAVLLSGMACGQETEAMLRASITGVRYPPLARQARIQGDVHLRLEGGAVKIIAGHPLLTLAVEGGVKLEATPAQPNLDVVFHFVLADTTKWVKTTTTVKRNAFETGILRMFGRKAEKVVQSERCESGEAPPTQINLNGVTIQVWIYGSIGCLQVNYALVARR